MAAVEHEAGMDLIRDHDETVPVSQRGERAEGRDGNDGAGRNVGCVEDQDRVLDETFRAISSASIPPGRADVTW